MTAGWVDCIQFISYDCVECDGEDWIHCRSENRWACLFAATHFCDGDDDCADGSDEPAGCSE